MTNMSRRSVAKGAAWSVPAVVAGAPAAWAAASTPPVDCTKNYFGSNFVGASWSKLAGTMSPDKTAWNDTTFQGGIAVSGTEWNIQLGNPSITPPNPAYTGIALYGDLSRKVQLKMANGATGTGTIPSGGQGITTPVVAASGLSTSIAVQSTVPYVGLCPAASETLSAISIPITVIWYEGTSATSPSSNACSYWLNYCYNTTPGGAGCYPLLPLATASSVTSTPTFLC